MIKYSTCNNCGSLLKYDNTSIHEGLRDFEDVLCPVCGNKIDTVFTDLIPVATVVKSNSLK